MLLPSGRVPHGARGLKLISHEDTSKDISRVPHGTRGLKYHDVMMYSFVFMSRPTWGAWIEMLTC